MKDEAIHKQIEGLFREIKDNPENSEVKLLALKVIIFLRELLKK